MSFSFFFDEFRKLYLFLPKKTLFIIYYLLYIIYYLLFIIYYLLFIIYYLLFIIYYYYLLFIIYYLLFIIYYLLFIIYLLSEFCSLKRIEFFSSFEHKLSIILISSGPKEKSELSSSSLLTSITELKKVLLFN